MHSPAELLAQAIALYQAGNINGAQAVAVSILSSHPEDANVLNFLGAVASQKGNFAESIRWLEKAVAVAPDYADACRNLGTVYYTLNKPNEALAGFDKAIAINPHDTQAHNTRATILHQLKRHDEAIAGYGNAIASDPHFFMAYNNRGIVLKYLKRYEEAIADYDQAIAINPEFAMAYVNRGHALFDRARYAEALESYNQAISLAPNLAIAYTSRGQALSALKQYEEALQDHDRALAIDPHYTVARWNKSNLLLLIGQYEEGWKLYECRWRIGDLDSSAITSARQPLWLGRELIAGRTLLLQAEQGFGDMIQFCRYIPMVEAMGAKVVVDVLPSIADLIATASRTANVIKRGSPLPDCDFRCPFGSLPLALKTTMDTIPDKVPYLFADSAKQNMWQERLGVKRKPRIGLVWSGRVNYANNRSISVHNLTPLLECDADFISLQNEIKPEDEAALADSKIMSFAKDLKNFSDTAALMSEMDMVISIDTSVAHLAGALGKPLWIMLAYIADWRWLNDRSDSPWYPTARLFRQTAAGDWDSVIAGVKAALMEKVFS